jgi:hypothetical protein
MRSSPRTARIVVVVIALFAAAFAVPAFVSSPAAAHGLGPLLIFGYVTDDEGNPATSVPVVVVLKNGTTTINTLYYDTDEFGFYSVNFNPETWDVGYTVTSTATSGGQQDSEKVTIQSLDDWSIQIDLQFPYEIPQFGTILGFLAAAAVVGAVAVYLLPRTLRSGRL